MSPVKLLHRLTLLCGLMIVGIVMTACAGRAVIRSTPTPTPVSTLITLPSFGPNSPILGDSWQVFDNFFGNSNCCYQDGWDYQGQFGPSWTGTIEAGDSATVLPSNHDSRVTGIQLDPQPSQQNWSASQAQSMLNLFMPPDAKREQSKTIYVGNVAVGTEETYSSGLLAHTLPKSDFMYIDASPAPPGVFFVYVNRGTQTGYDVSTLGTNESYVLTST